MPGESKVTTDHNEIRKWVEERDGFPATVKGTSGKDDPGLQRIEYEGYSGNETLERISWEEFFEKFEEKKLAFLYQDEKSSGEESRFSKIISREK